MLQQLSPSLTLAHASSLALDGVCDACVQRFCGVSEGARGSAWASNAPALLRAEGGATAAPRAVCVACLGILDASGGATPSTAEGSTSASASSVCCVEAASAALLDAIATRGYDVDGFCLEFTLPNSCVVRQYGLVSKLIERERAAGGERTRAQLESGTISLKDVVRARLLAAIAPRLSPADASPEATLRLHVRIAHVDSDRECAALVQATGGGGGSGGGSANRNKYNRKRRRVEKRNPSQTQQHSTRDLLQRMAKLERSDAALACASAAPPLSATRCSVTVRVSRNSVWVAGRYRKLRRGISQTPFYVDGVRRGSTSVEELLSTSLTAKRADRFALADARALKFMSSGREDIDVRMLGCGRPFALELVDATRVGFDGAALRAMQDEANAAAAGELIFYLIRPLTLHFLRTNPACSQ